MIDPHLRRFCTALALSTLVACGAGPPPDRSADAAQRFTEAGLAVQSGALERAAALYDEAGTLDPQSVKIWLAASHTRGRLGQWAQAVARAEQARALAPADPRVSDALARAHVAGGDVPAARTVWLDFVGAYPEVAVGWRALGSLAALQNDFEAGEAALSKAAALAPEDADAWERLGAIRQRAGRAAAAARAFDQAIRLDPKRHALEPRVMALALHGGDRALAHTSAARMAGPNAPVGAGSMAVAAMLIKREDYLGAANELEELLERHPKHAHGTLMLAQVLARVQRFDEAQRLLALLPEQTPVRADVLRLTGLLRMRVGDHAAATEALGEATRLAPNRASLQRDYAEALHAANRPKAALAVLADAVARWPKNADLLYAEANARHALGDEAGALTRMLRVVQLAPKHSGALNFVGYTWAEQGVRLGEAEGMIRLALESRPKDASITDSLGWVLYRQGRIEEALEALQSAIARAPDEPEVRFHLAVVLHAAGRLAEAKAAFEQTLKLAPTKQARRLWRVRWRRTTQR
jgi:tetratricopeptide (TPR) repeat protein